MAELKALVAELPARDAVQAAAAVGHIEGARRVADQESNRAMVSAALTEIEAAANRSVGVLSAAEKIIAIARRLAAVLL